MWRRRTIILVLIALIPLLVGVIAHLVETDEEQVERVLDEAVRAAIDGKERAVVQRLTPDATRGGWLGEGELLPEVGSRVREAHGMVESVSLDLQSLTVEGDEARGTWTGVAKLRRRSRMPYGRVLFAADLEFRRVQESWRICRVVIRRR
jgi:hypothetical protein